MTVQDVSSETTFVGDGIQVSFAFSFRVDDPNWLTLSYLTNFINITLNGNQQIAPGGVILYNVAPPVDQQLTITRNVPLSQNMDYTRYGPFDSESHEDALDKITMMIQDRDKQTARKSKSITIEGPSTAEDITMFYTPVQLRISEIQAVLRGSGAPSVTWTIRFASDRSAVGTEVVSGGTVTANVTIGDNITLLNNPAVPAGSFVWLETTAGVALVNTFHITIRYTEDLP